MAMKFFAWIDQRGYMCGQKLVPLRAVASMRQTLQGLQTFATVQTYDSDGAAMYCPLYADLDGEPAQALYDAQYIVYLLGEMTNVIPDIYYTGNKGYHIVIPHKVEGTHCHLVAKHFFNYLAAAIPTLDQRVYTEHRLFRLPNSAASRPGYFKIQLTKRELMGLTPQQIEQMAEAPRQDQINEYDGSQLNDEFFRVLKTGVEKIPRWAGEEYVQYATSLGEEMTPCMARMIETPPEKGTRNQTVALIARLMKKSGLSLADTSALLLSKPHFADFEREERGVSQAVSGIYKSKRPAVLGCKIGNDASLMKKFCDPICWFNEEKLAISFGKKVAV